MKKRILCFGDSNTYGANPQDLGRYDENTRFTGLLQQKLGPEYVVIEGGRAAPRKVSSFALPS